MLDVYVPEPLTTLRRLPFLAPTPETDSRLFQTLPFDAYVDIVRIVPAAEAAYLLVPHEYSALVKVGKLAPYLAEAQALGKRPIVFAYRDNPEPIRIHNAIIFRPSAYKSRLLPNEVIMPAYVEDLGAANDAQPLPKGERARVGFAGKAGFSGMRERARYAVRNHVLRHGPDREGMYFRRQALASLARDPRIELDAIVRRRFSANRKTIELAKEDARASYVRSLKENLFTLAPRGDGNYSLRFYETLSMGRIPILIDTDMALPFEDRIAYDSFILRIPWQETARTGALVAAFFAGRSQDELVAMQQRARDAFATHLYMPRYLAAVLTPTFLETIPTL